MMYPLLLGDARFLQDFLGKQIADFRVSRHHHSDLSAAKLVVLCASDRNIAGSQQKADQFFLFHLLSPLFD